MATPYRGVQPKKRSLIPTADDLKAMWDASGLREKLLFTIGAIALYRFLVLIPVWGVDASAIRQLAGGQLLSFIDMFSGGALTSVSIIALGIGPYITASIVMQLMTVVVPRLEELQKEEGESGRRKIAQYTRYLTVGLAVLQSILVLKFVSNVPGAIFAPNMPMFYVFGVLSMTAGAVFALWLAEIITERGIGNGGSLLILAGILSRIPLYAGQTYDLVANNQEKSVGLLLLLAIYLGIIALVVVLQLAERKIFVVSVKRQVNARQMAGGQSTHIPFKINPAGVMPIIFAFAVLSFPATVIQVIQQGNPTGFLQEVVLFWGRYMAPGTWVYIAIEFALIVFFTFFYASIIPSMQPKQIAENLKKYGSSIPGIKPGRPTAEKLEEILTRTTLIGAVALGAITLIASSATSITGINTLYLGATSLIIMVGVAMDTMNQIRVHLLARSYEGFLK